MRCSMTAALCAYFLSPVSRYASPRFSSPSTRCLCHIQDRKSTRLNSSHSQISYAVFCLKKKIGTILGRRLGDRRCAVGCRGLDRVYRVDAACGALYLLLLPRRHGSDQSSVRLTTVDLRL